MAVEEDRDDTAATPTPAAPVEEDTLRTAAGTPEPPMPFALEPVLPPKRTGLIVVVAAALLLLVAAVAGAMVLTPLAHTLLGSSDTRDAQSTRDAAAMKARIETAIGLMEALRVNNLGAVRPFLTDKAQTAITAEQWSEVASTALASGVPSATFSPAKWTGSATATVDYAIDGATGTMSFSPNPARPNVVTMTENGPDGQLVYDVELAANGTGWRVVALTPMAERYPLDEDFVKSLVDTTSAP